MRSKVSFPNWRSMVKLYCSAYWERRWGPNSPKSRAGRKVDQSTQPLGPPAAKHGVLGVWLMMLPALLGLSVPFCKRNGVLNEGLDKETLVPKGGSAANCSSTSSSMGL